MVTYETINSPFYTENKQYCEAIEHMLKTMNLGCSGYWNAYGYELETTFEKSNFDERETSTEGNHNITLKQA